MTTESGVPFVSPFTTPALVDGVYPTTACLNDARRDAERRDAALVRAVYELGVEQLRLAALDRTPAFLEAVRTAA